MTEERERRANNSSAENQKGIAQYIEKEMRGPEEADFSPIKHNIVTSRLSQVKNFVSPTLLWNETATDSNPTPPLT